MNIFNDDDVNPFILLHINEIHREFTRLGIEITSVRFLRHRVTIIRKKRNGKTAGVSICFNTPNAPPIARYFNLLWPERYQARPRVTTTL